MESRNKLIDKQKLRTHVNSRTLKESDQIFIIAEDKTICSTSKTQKKNRIKFIETKKCLGQHVDKDSEPLTKKTTSLNLTFKGYLRYKTIFCNKSALDVQLMNFFYLKKKQCFVLEISRFLCFCKMHGF